MVEFNHHGMFRIDDDYNIQNANTIYRIRHRIYVPHTMNSLLMHSIIIVNRQNLHHT